MTTITTTETYTYATLETERQSIRVLDLIPDAFDASLRAVLRHVSLLDTPKPVYESISYVWGDATRLSLLEVHDDCHDPSHPYGLLIPQSTEEALKRARLADRARTVWIDAVCINQDDLEERSSQVLLMSTIYSNSVDNLVMLAPTMEPSLASRIVRAVNWLYDDATNHTEHMRLFHQSIYRRGMLNLTYEGLPAELDVAALLACFRLPWFQRLWVLQEATLAPSNTVFLGSETLSLVHVLRALSWWQHKAESKHVLNDSEAFFGFNCVFELHKLADREYGASVSTTRTHGSLLLLATGFARSEPKDGIYAIAGLLDHPLPPELKIDYRLPLGEILQRHTRYALSTNYSTILSFVRHRKDDLSWSGIASWAFRADRMYLPSLDPMLLPGIYWACDGLSSESVMVSVPGQSTSSLSVRGIVIDSIRKTTNTCPVTKWTFEIVQWLKQAFELIPDNAESSNSDVAVRTVAEVSIVGRTWAGSTSEHDFEAVVDFVRAARAYKRSPSDDHTDLAAMLWRATGIASLKYIDHQKMFSTAKGSIGLGPGIMKEGDVLVLVRGVHVPLVLRPSAGGQFQLVGSAYVRGIMRGEAVAAHKAAGGQEVVLELI